MGFFRIPKPANEPVLNYIKGSTERDSLKEELKNQLQNKIEIPLIIDGQEIKTGKTVEIRCPHDHSKVLAVYHTASKEDVKDAVIAALNARQKWADMSWNNRAAIFLKAAELLAGPKRMQLNAATMLGQSKTVHQAEIDSACELIDFWRMNCYFMQQIYADQPDSSPAVWNRVEYRPLEGFVFAITPFNFTSIAGNLPTAPALMGNVVLWKPASTAVLSSYYIMKLLEDAGLPKGVINFIPGKGSDIGDIVLSNRELAGIHFTGSTSVFKSMWKKVSDNIDTMRYYPRLVGETGGKDFVFAYKDCDLDALVVALIRGSFEYQGQKCSAASRAYIPASIWNTVKNKLIEETKKLKTGDILDFANFMGAVIDKESFNKLKTAIDEVKNSKEAKIVVGGTYDDSKGYFIHPTIVETTNPLYRTMTEELFGPILTIYVYDDNKLDTALDLVDTSSDYALTGAVFAKDRNIISLISKKLENSAGNFYINDKPTGAVVGQQPFGGARASGTNDKAGSYLNLLRWTSARSIKENFIPAKEVAYPFMK